ncbi:MAG: hypothetical protein WAN86_17305 [Hyphomicrobiaceae bacterium]
MRTLLAAVIFLGGLSALNSTAEAQRSQECQQAQNEDPTGQFAGYPCWAQESFARGSGSGGGE